MSSVILFYYIYTVSYNEQDQQLAPLFLLPIK